MICKNQREWILPVTSIALDRRNGFELASGTIDSSPTPCPLDTLHTPIPVRRHFGEQGRAQIDIGVTAGPAGVDDFCLMRLARGRVGDGDHRAAFGVGVGVGGVAHHGSGEGDNIVVVVVQDAAGSQPSGVMGHVALVAERGAAKEEKRKEEEK